MQEWVAAETNTHQDHVIAHVIGATVVGFFTWDETAYFLLDIGFIWNIYLDGEMGLVPQTQAVNELEAGEDFKRTLRSDMDALARDGEDSVLKQLSIPLARSPIQTVDFEQCGNSRRFVITCEESRLVVETSLETAEVQIHEQ
jgi:hypothetical protein